MKKFPVSLLCGIASILLTIVLYFTVLGNVVLEIIHFVTLSAVVLAEVITTLYAIHAKGNPRKVAATVVSALMIPISVWLSFVYILNFPNNYGTYLGWYFAGTIAVNALALILLLFDSNKSKENVQFQAAKSNILYMRKLVKCIMTDPATKSYETKLRIIEEKLHFTNDSVSVPEDAEILQMLDQLQQNIKNPDFDTAALLEKIEQTITKRTIMTSHNV